MDAIIDEDKIKQLIYSYFPRIGEERLIWLTKVVAKQMELEMFETIREMSEI